MRRDTDPVYGYCPICGGMGSSRERSPDGNTVCAKGHVYPSIRALKTMEQAKIAEEGYYHGSDPT